MTSTEPEAAASALGARRRRLGVLPALDGVRGLAVFLVVITHLQLLVPYEVTGVDRLDDLIEGSYLGVDLFFVLSGFLITALLLDELLSTRNLRFGAFYGRRALRLLPALYVLLAAHAIYAVVADLSWFQEWATIRSALLYVSNWQLVFRPLTGVPDLGLLWSLAIEEQFYLIWPAALVLLFSPRRHLAVVVASLVAIILTVAVWRAHLWSEGVFWAQLAVRTDTRIDSLLVGCLLAMLWVRGATPKRGVNAAGWVGLAAIVVCLGTFDITEGTGYKGGLTLFAVASSAVILALLGETWGGRHLFDFRPLRAMGRVSYGIYLWHYPIFYAVSVQGEQWTNLERVVVALGLTAVATIGSHYLIERPALGLKGRFGIDRSKSGPSTAGIDVTAEGPESRAAAPLRTLGPTGRVALAMVGVLVAVAVLRFTVFVGDPATPYALPDPGGLEFPAGDIDRSGYWRLVGLEATDGDAFDRADNAADLGTTATGEPWGVVSGTWGVLTESAVVTGGSSGGTLLAVVPQARNDGLVEVTLRVAASGSGLAFRFIDPTTYWMVTADPTTLRWTVTQVIDGSVSTAGEFVAPVFDGVTISVSQSGSTVRFLINGVEYFRLLDPAPTAATRAGLAAVGAAAGGARWDRFLVLAPRDQLESGG